MTDAVLTDERLPEPRSFAASLRRTLAMLVLPASLVPIVLFGSGMLLTPLKIGREWNSEVQRIEQSLQSHKHAPAPEPPLAVRLPLAPVYGHWSAFPQAGREQFPGPTG